MERVLNILQKIIAMFEDTSPNSFLGEISIENSIFFISDVSIFF